VTIIVRLLVVIFVTLGTSSCFQEYQHLKQGESYLKQQKYQAAINLFNKYDSKRSKELNSQAHQDYAVSVLTNLDTEKSLRYGNAKLALRKALDLNPNNQSARAFYKMLCKSIETELSPSETSSLEE